MAEQINESGNSFVLTSTDAASAQLPLNLEFDSNPPVSTLDLESGMDFTGPYPGAFSGGCNNATLTWNFSAFVDPRVHAYAALFFWWHIMRKAPD